MPLLHDIMLMFSPVDICRFTLDAAANMLLPMFSPLATRSIALCRCRCATIRFCFSLPRYYFTLRAIMLLFRAAAVDSFRATLCYYAMRGMLLDGAARDD